MSVSLSTPVFPPVATTTAAAPYWTPSAVVEYVKEGLLEVDAVFSRIITSFPPGASAEKTELQECLGQNLPLVYEVTQAGVTKHDPNMLTAAHQLYGPFFQQCFEDETYNKLRQEHDSCIKYHEKETQAIEAKLEKCEKDNPGYRCYKLVEISKRPMLERVKGDDEAHAREWKTLPGYLCWTINVNLPWRPDKFYAKGGYNCDLTTNKPTV